MERLSPADAERAACFHQALASVDDDLSLPMLRALLTVALKPGISVNELGDIEGLTQQTASRYAAVLSGRYQALGTEEPRDALIIQELNVEDPRKRALSLSEIGVELVRRVTASLSVVQEKAV